MRPTRSSGWPPNATPKRCGPIVPRRSAPSW
ncbi:Uncharacterised protein [Bordetella pertussis]|nr:Uncharacterised protein [Bordetella pertussis]